MEKLKKLILSFALLFASTIMYAQTEISGTVVDATGETVIGATVMEKGTSNGTITDFDGNFKLKVEAGKILVISYIGYKTQELPAKDGMQVTMKDNAKELAEVVVTGYQTQRKADLTGSVSVVETKDLKTSSDTDPMRALQGKVPGMTITSNGSPVGAGTVRIRGIGSFNSSQDPLFVIDGVPTTTNLNTLNMNDIESMQAPLNVEGNEVIIDLFVDQSSVEILTKDGAMSMTNLVFPQSIYDHLLINGNASAQLRNLSRIW